MQGDIMIRCEVIENFTLRDYEKLKNIKRKSIDIKGNLFVGDKFECDEQMCEYLMGNNKYNMSVVKIVEVKPETINKKNALETLNKAIEQLEKEELVETIPVVNKNGIVVDRIIKDKPKKKKTSKK